MDRFLNDLPLQWHSRNGSGGVVETQSNVAGASCCNSPAKPTGGMGITNAWV